MTPEEVGRRIAEFRKLKGMTQSELAEKLSVTNKAVSKWETGEGFPDITSIPVLAAALEVSTDMILCGDNKPKKEPKAVPTKDARRMRALIAIEFAVTLVLAATWMPMQPLSLGSVIDWGSFIWMAVIAVVAAIAYRQLRQEKSFLRALIIAGLPAGGVLTALSNLALTIYNGYTLTLAAQFAMIPMLYVSIFGLLFYLLYMRRQKRSNKKSFLANKHDSEIPGVYSEHQDTLPAVDTPPDN